MELVRLRESILTPEHSLLSSLRCNACYQPLMLDAMNSRLTRSRCPVELLDVDLLFPSKPPTSDCYCRCLVKHHCRLMTEHLDKAPQPHVPLEAIYSLLTACSMRFPFILLAARSLSRPVPFDWLRLDSRRYGTSSCRGQQWFCDCCASTCFLLVLASCSMCSTRVPP